MVWLIAFLVAHSVEIAAIGTAAYAINEIGQVAITTTAIVKEVNKNDVNKEP